MSLLGLGMFLANVTSNLVLDSPRLVNVSLGLANISSTVDNGGCPNPEDYSVFSAAYNKYVCAFIFKVSCALVNN